MDSMRAGLNPDQMVPVLVTDLDVKLTRDIFWHRKTHWQLWQLLTPMHWTRWLKNLAQQGNDTMTAMLAKMHPQVDLTAAGTDDPVDDPRTSTVGA